MSFRKEHLMIEKYNKLFNLSGSKLKALEWSESTIRLNTCSINTPQERRKFRVRCSSQLLVSHLDTIYTSSNSSVDRDLLVRTLQKKHASITNKNYWKKLPQKIKAEKIQHMRHVQKFVDYSKVKRQEPWNKGKTKDTDNRLLLLSQQRTGKGNPAFGRKMSEKEKRRKSKLIKERIESGVWTPHVHNSRTHWECVYNTQRYRSSWEAMYASLNPSDAYEQVRISYTYGQHKHIYIVDFVNHFSKTLTEVKPSAYTQNEKVKSKVKAAENWCSQNGYNFRIVTQSYFVEHYDKIPFKDISIPNLRQKIARIKYEASKENQNQKTGNNI